VRSRQDGELSGLDPGDVEEIVDQAVHAVGGAMGGLARREDALVRGLVPERPAKAAHERLDHPDRVPEIVRDDGQDLVA
jgi:hypothetical protein